jgi:hypothetical protein
MPPKKKDGKKKAAKVDDRPGQQPEALLETYTAFCKKIGLPPNAEVIGSLSNEEVRRFLSARATRSRS